MQQLQLPKLRKIDPNKPKKKKILLLSDDLRLHSGIATMSREFVVGTAHVFDWVQLGAAIKHPDAGKIIDLSDSVRTELGIDDADVRIYANNGYGDPNTLRELIKREKPDAIMHFTDPRFWGWLYQMEHEIRQHTPILYYNIWDDLPYPFWNEDFYESCDMLLNISKQTQNIVTNVLRRFPKEEWAVQYVPHGINEKNFYTITEQHAEWNDYQKLIADIKTKNNVNFVLFWNNRNIRRKQPGDVILAYKEFCDRLPKEHADRCALFMHTQPVDENGTDLFAVKDAICPDYKIFFSDKGVDTKVLNMYYNLADATINIASNEGFGISGIESLMAGTPIINNVTGGLQDHMRFEDENGNWINFDTEFSSNHTGRYKKCGKWAKPVFPSNRSLQGSVPTPYIFDDRVAFENVADAIMYWYTMDSIERKECGLAGQTWVRGDESMMSAKHMSDNFIKHINICLEKWTPRERFALYQVTKKQKIENPGIVI
jgi:glycosyltransferase involved in cell wall biosynthesis